MRGCYLQPPISLWLPARDHHEVGACSEVLSYTRLCWHAIDDEEDEEAVEYVSPLHARQQDTESFGASRQSPALRPVGVSPPQTEAENEEEGAARSGQLSDQDLEEKEDTSKSWSPEEARKTPAAKYHSPVQEERKHLAEDNEEDNVQLSPQETSEEAEGGSEAEERGELGAEHARSPSEEAEPSSERQRRTLDDEGSEGEEHPYEVPSADERTPTSREGSLRGSREGSPSPRSSEGGEQREPSVSPTAAYLEDSPHERRKKHRGRRRSLPRMSAQPRVHSYHRRASLDTDSSAAFEHENALSSRHSRTYRSLSPAPLSASPPTVLRSSEERAMERQKRHNKSRRRTSHKHSHRNKLKAVRRREARRRHRYSTSDDSDDDGFGPEHENLGDFADHVASELLLSDGAMAHQRYSYADTFLAYMRQRQGPHAAVGGELGTATAPPWERAAALAYPQAAPQHDGYPPPPPVPTDHALSQYNQETRPLHEPVPNPTADRKPKV